MKNPEVSVLLPCHGDAPYLTKAVESVLIQSFTDFELLIILDRASITTSELVEKFEQSDSRIKVLISNKAGISEALNLGIQCAAGKFIARIDSDDLMLRTRIEEQRDVFRLESSLVCLGTQVSIIDDNGNFIRNTNYPISDKGIRRALKVRNVIAHPSVMLLRSAVIEAGGYRPIFNGAEDYDLWLRLAKNGKIRNLKTPLTQYRTHSGQVTQENRARQLQIDSEVRKSFYGGNAAYSKISESSSLKSAQLINEFLRESSPKRISKIVMAFLINPFLVLNFSLNLLVPEIRGRLNPCKK